MIFLTQQNYSSKEIIKNVFSPLVGSISSPHAEEICHKNNLSFTELLQPFSRLTNEAHFRDVSGTAVSVKGLRLNFCDVNWRPPQTNLAKKILSEAVISANNDLTRPIDIGAKFPLDIPTSEPWFEQWRETFLTVQHPNDFEYTRHLLCCLIVLSSSDPTPLETAAQLTRKVQLQQTGNPPQLPKWFASEVLNCYVMLHDGCNGDISRAQQSFESLKAKYGENRCFLVQINSFQGTPAECPDPWLRYLRRYQKTEAPSDQSSTPKTPQDMINVVSMPSTVQSASMASTPPMSAMDEIVVHPLSPTSQENPIAMSAAMSTSAESLSSQIINPNVWGHESIDAPHGVWLTPGDVDNLRHFVQDFTVRALIPYVENLVAVLNDAIANKKGVSRSLLSATKRWFVTNKPGSNTTQNAVVYTAESTELQTRKLGDLHFMFGNYNMAFQSYHQAKRDFNADSAWHYYAGALEMAALSAFMGGVAEQKTYDYMEDSIHTYLNSCKLPQFATRATLLSVECLKSAKKFGEAAKQLIRMTSEDSDLRSALLLEQAAYCFLMTQPPLFRKYAFHIVLAGHRFSKSGQRKHALRCYKQAYQVFEGREWSLAEDHIQYTIGKQAVTLKKLDVASNALSHLLRPSSLQSAEQQAAFLREYIATQKTYIGNNEEAGLLDITLPRIVQNSVRVLVTSHPAVSSPHWTPATNISIDSSSADEWKWHKLEEMAVQAAINRPTMVFRPQRPLFTSDAPTTENPLCVHGEPIEISFDLENTIRPVIIFEDINLLWTFTNLNGQSITNREVFKQTTKDGERLKMDNIVLSNSIKGLQLNENEKRPVKFTLTPRFTGTLKIDGVVGRISSLNDNSALWGKLSFEPIPIKVHPKNANADKPPQFDNKLEIVVLPPAPALHVSFSQIPQDILAGEIIPVKMNLTNAGSEPLTEIFMSTEHPRWLLFDPSRSDQELPLSLLRDFKDLTNENLSRDKEARKQHVFRILKTNDGDAPLQPKETKALTLWLQAPYQKGAAAIRALVYYNTPDGYAKLSYRLVRHVWNFQIHDSLSLEANCNVTHMKTPELGLDVAVKNLNQDHHPLMTEIFLDNVALFCPEFKVNPDKIFYVQSPGYHRIKSEGKGLKSCESMGLRCGLKAMPAKSTNESTEFVTERLSSFDIKSCKQTLSIEIPKNQSLQSFLMKHETKFIGVFEKASNSEEFNAIVANEDKHMTVALTWTALVSDNCSLQRKSFGQHFVQLRNLFESTSCPVRENPQTNFTVHKNIIRIYDFENKIEDNTALQQDDPMDFWPPSTANVAHRCFLEVPSDEESSEK